MPQLRRSRPGGRSPLGPDGLQGSAEGQAWLATLPGLLEACAAHWHLTLGPPFPDSYVSLALPARMAGGAEVVLKLQFPGRASAGEAAALAAWNGDGAVQLLDHDPERHALLLERCVPGEPLTRLPPVEALDVLVGLVPRLSKPAPPGFFRTLADEAASWAVGLRAGRLLDPALVDAVLDALAWLAPGAQVDAVLVHQDLHPGNVLSARREPWLAIDPTPVWGERALAAVPLVRTSELGHTEAQVRARLNRVSAALGLDRERVRLWTAAQALAWGIGTEIQAERVETARWLLAM